MSKSTDSSSERKRTTGSSRNRSRSRNVDQLYEIYDKLSASTDKEKLEDDFKELIRMVSDGDKERSMASQFLTRFAEYFPKLASKVANALFDLCEDDDVSNRKQAEKDLVTLAKKFPRLVPMIADVFAQILRTENVGEVTGIESGLMTLFHYNPEGALTGVFAHIRTGDPPSVDRCFKFIHSKLRSLGPPTPSMEQRIWEEVRKAITRVDSNFQCVTIMDLLNSTKKAKTDEGRKGIVELLEIMLFQSQDKDSLSNEDVARLINLADFAFPYFDGTITSAKIFTFFCTNVLKKLSDMSAQNKPTYFLVLRLTVELSLYMAIMTEDEAKICLDGLLSELERFLYEVPEVQPVGETPPDYNFSFIESIVHMCYNLIRMHPGLLDSTVRTREGLLPKVGYLLQAVIPYQSRVRLDLQRFSITQVRSQVDKVKCLRCLSNISMIGKVFYNGKIGQEKIRLSWKVTALTASSACRSPAIFSPRGQKISRVSRSRVDRQRDERLSHGKLGIYQPPEGKYSAMVRHEKEPSRRKIFSPFKRANDSSDLRHRLGKRY